MAFLCKEGRDHVVTFLWRRLSPLYYLLPMQRRQGSCLWSMEYDGGCWNPFFFVPFNDWELDEVVRFMRKRVIDGKEDTI